MDLQHGTTYVFRNVESGTVVTVGNIPNPKKPSASVTGSQASGTPQQQWTVEKTNDGHVRLKNADNLYLGFSGEPSKGNPILARPYKQKWKAVISGFNYQFVAPDTSLSLDLDFGQRTDGAKIVLWPSRMSLNQFWVPEPVQQTSQGDPSGASALQVNKPYNIINLASATAFEIEETGRLIGFERLAKRNGQKWILETASSGQFFIMHQETKTYLGHSNQRIASSQTKQPWIIQRHSSSPNSFKIIRPDHSAAVNLDRGSSAPGTPVNLWKPRNTMSQVWKFELFEPPKPFEWGHPYLIINSASETVADVEDPDEGGDSPHVVGNKHSLEEHEQHWTFEEAPNRLVYVRNSSEAYAGIDEGDVADNGTEIVCTDKKQPWDVQADEKDPTKFRIFYPGTKYNIALEDGKVTPGTTIQLEKFDPEEDSQRWKFRALTKTKDDSGNTVLTPEKNVHIASQYYDDLFFPQQDIRWLRAFLKRSLTEGWFFPIRPSRNSVYQEPIKIDPNTSIEVSNEPIKKLSNQDMWLPGDWRFAIIKGRDGKEAKGRIRFDNLQDAEIRRR